MNSRQVGGGNVASPFVALSARRSAFTQQPQRNTCYIPRQITQRVCHSWLTLDVVNPPRSAKEPVSISHGAERGASRLVPIDRGRQFCVHVLPFRPKGVRRAHPAEGTLYRIMEE